MKEYLCLLLVLCLVFTGVVYAGEIVRQKNVATYVFFPIVDGDGDPTTGCTCDTELDTFADGTAPDGFADATNEATEIGTSGWYYLSLTQAEMNFDYIAIQTKVSVCTAKTQGLLIRTMVGDPLNLATTASGTTVWGEIVESTYSYADYMRLSAAVLFGDWTMADAVATFRDVPDTKDRVVETLTSGERDVTSLTGN